MICCGLRESKFQPNPAIQTTPAQQVPTGGMWKCHWSIALLVELCDVYNAAGEVA